MSTPAKLTDQCLWIKHVAEGPVRQALASLEPHSTIRLLVDGDLIHFRKMSTGGDGRTTAGLAPVGETAVRWRNRYKPNEHLDIFLDFAGEQVA